MPESSSTRGHFSIPSLPLTVLTIFGTRPDVIKLFPVVARLRQNPKFRSVVVSTSQHREMIDDLLQSFALPVDHDLNIIRANHTLTDISVRALAGLDPILQQHRPDLVLVQGDTTTAFIGALSSFYGKIPVGHVEAGLRSFDKQHPYPEEINRRLISTIGSLHFAPTQRNAENLQEEGIPSDCIFVTGNTVIDSLLFIARRGRRTLDHHLPAAALGCRRLILVTAHRRENWGEPLENLCLALQELVRSFDDIRIVFPVHLNPNVRKTVFARLADCDRIHLIDPMPYEPFVEAMLRSHFIITDSGGIQEEGPSLRKPVLVFREVTERPEGVEGGGVKLVGLDRRNLVREASSLLAEASAYRRMIASHNPYGDGRAARRIEQAILHYFLQADRPASFVSHAQMNGKTLKWNFPAMQTTPEEILA
jgi:UDP-N-acetylglucosamine 2-epimerase (non-hydrolysing)